MNDQEKKRLELLEGKLKNRYKYQNDYIKNNYDKIVLTFPKGSKQTIDNAAKSKGFKNTSEYIKRLIDDDINGAGAGSAIIPDYIPTKTKLVNYSAEVLAPEADDDIKPQTEKTPAQAATNSALESRLDRLLNDHT